MLVTLRALGRSMSAADAGCMGLVIAAGAGALMVVALAVGRRRQPPEAPLAASDRIEVIHAVATGSDIGDTRLAVAVIERAGVVRRAPRAASPGTWLGGVVVGSSLAPPSCRWSTVRSGRRARAARSPWRSSPSS